LSITCSSFAFCILCFSSRLHSLSPLLANQHVMNWWRVLRQRNYQ
jgi:hypothetical protein